MKRYLVLSFLLIVKITTFGQTIKVDSSGVFFGSNKLISALSIVNSLGVQKRTTVNKYKIWTYDKLGLIIYLDPRNSELKKIILEFKKQDFIFSPKKQYSGTFLVFGHPIDKNTPMTDLRKIEQLKFPMKFTIGFEYLGYVNTLKAVTIEF